MNEKTDLKGMMLGLLRKIFETDSLTKGEEDRIVYCMAAAFKAGTEFRAKTAIEKVSELTRQNKILREALTASKAALIRLGEGKTANVFMINEALKSCSGGDNE